MLSRVWLPAVTNGRGKIKRCANNCDKNIWLVWHAVIVKSQERRSNDICIWKENCSRKLKRLLFNWYGSALRNIYHMSIHLNVNHGANTVAKTEKYYGAVLKFLQRYHTWLGNTTLIWRRIMNVCKWNEVKKIPNKCRFLHLFGIFPEYKMQMFGCFQNKKYQFLYVLYVY